MGKVEQGINEQVHASPTKRDQDTNGQDWTNRNSFRNRFFNSNLTNIYKPL